MIANAYHWSYLLFAIQPSSTGLMVISLNIMANIIQAYIWLGNKEQITDHLGFQVFQVHLTWCIHLSKFR